MAGQIRYVHYSPPLNRITTSLQMMVRIPIRRGGGQKELEAIYQKTAVAPSQSLHGQIITFL